MCAAVFANSEVNGASQWQAELSPRLSITYYSRNTHLGYDYTEKCNDVMLRTQVPEFSFRNIPSEKGLPGIEVNYYKIFNYFDLPLYEASLKLDKRLDLSGARRMTGTITIHCGHGYYAGHWNISLLDAAGKKMTWCISKEAWDCRDGRFFELPLGAAPDGFDWKNIAEIQFFGHAPVQAHRGRIILEGLAFDDKLPVEGEEKRVSAWQKAMSLESAMRVEALPPWQMVKPDFTGQGPEVFSMRTALGGAADVQLAVIPGKGEKSELTVEAGDFRSAGGNVISAGNVKLYEVIFVTTKPEEYDGVFEEHYEDVLRPLPGGSQGKVNLPNDRITLIWAKVTVPENAAPGKYDGCITVGGKKQLLTLTVDDFVMPERPTLQTSFWIFPHYISPNAADMNVLRPWLDTALAEKMTPILTTGGNNQWVSRAVKQADGTYSVDINVWKEYYEYVMNNGGNCIHLADTHGNGARLFDIPAAQGFPGETPEDKEIHFTDRVAPHRQQIMSTLMNEAMDFVKKNGWEEYAYLQLWDEPTPEAEKKILPIIYPTTAKLCPEAPLALTQKVPESIKEYVKVPIPTLPALDNGVDGGVGYSANIRAAGGKPWVYSCMSYGITLMEVPVRNRLLPLYCFRGKVTGYLFWSLNFYKTANFKNFPAEPWPMYRDFCGVDVNRDKYIPSWHKENPWQKKETVGDGILIYPPEPGSNEPMPCQRMMLWRCGMEDYEYLVELQRCLEEKQDRIPPALRFEMEKLLDLDTLLMNAWEKPEMVDDLRAKIGDAINQLKNGTATLRKE